MELDRKVVAAIGTAVTAYIQDEKAQEQAVRMLATPQATNMWSQSGRQELMRNRQMWQLRIVPG